MEATNNFQTDSQPNQVPSMGQGNSKGKKPIILILIIVCLVLVGAVAAFLLLGEDDAVDTDPTQDAQELDITDIDPEDVNIIEGSESGLNEELEDAFKLSEEFPQDLPLSGGTLTTSTSDSINHSAQISVVASLQEAREWYSSALTENGWEITDVSEYSPEEMIDIDVVEMTFEKADEERIGDLAITANPYTSTVNIHIREVLMTF